MPLNIQVGLQQVIDRWPDEQTIELCDCDMLHLRPSPVGQLPHGVLHVCDLYENWHLRCLTDNREVIAPYLSGPIQLDEGSVPGTEPRLRSTLAGSAGCACKYANGGFVPIVGTVKTFKTILHDWIAIHRDILARSHNELHRWWAGMFSLQAAAERQQVKMLAQDHTYIPGINELQPQHYIAHYSVDRHIHKHHWPPNPDSLPRNRLYDLVRAYLDIELNIR